MKYYRKKWGITITWIKYSCKSFSYIILSSLYWRRNLFKIENLFYVCKDYTLGLGKVFGYQVKNKREFKLFPFVGGICREKPLCGVLVSLKCKARKYAGPSEFRCKFIAQKWATDVLQKGVEGRVRFLPKEKVAFLTQSTLAQLLYFHFLLFFGVPNILQLYL